MKRSVVLLGVAVLLMGSAHASDDPVARAMKLYEKHRYEDAARDLRREVSSLGAAKQAAAHLALGMIYLKSAELHRELHQAAVAVSIDYLRRLSGDRGKSRSRLSDLYYGEALLEGGRADAAVRPLEKFLASGAPGPRHQSLAKIDLGLAFYLTGEQQKAREIWSALDTRDPEVKVKLAAVYSRTGVSDENPPAVCDEAIADLKKAGPELRAQAVGGALGVYARAGQFEKGLELLKRTDPGSFADRETIGKSKIISFYDPSLLSGLSALYLRASLASLEKAAADPQLRSTASYYLGEAHALAGNIDQSLKTTAVFLSSPQAPPLYKNRAMVRQAANRHQKGQQTDAYGTWSDLAQKQHGDPDVLAEILFTCGRLGIDCPRIANDSLAAAEKGEGKRFSVLQVGLGRYYQSKKDFAKAITFLEAGRDKGNKNKIESNDPLMLVSLSDAYYRSKKFSEALEIYFEMSKQFPQVRQIQEAMQGVYSMEHKSAGDVKIN